MTAQRICDVFLAVVLLLVCLPMMSVVCLLMALETSGAPFVRRDRVTVDGRIVRVFQLRASLGRGASLNPSIIVRIVHQLHIDQVPQLFNVLLGDLSLVGQGRDDVGGRSLLAWLER